MNENQIQKDFVPTKVVNEYLLILGLKTVVKSVIIFKLIWSKQASPTLLCKPLIGWVPHVGPFACWNFWLVFVLDKSFKGLNCSTLLSYSTAVYSCYWYHQFLSSLCPLPYLEKHFVKFDFRNVLYCYICSVEIFPRRIANSQLIISHIWQKVCELEVLPPDATALSKFYGLPHYSNWVLKWLWFYIWEIDKKALLFFVCLPLFCQSTLLLPCNENPPVCDANMCCCCRVQFQFIVESVS